MNSKSYLNYSCKKIFLIKAKKFGYFCIGCPKSALRGGRTKFSDFFS